jgi:NADH:ubiquinone oxidoreductase subunit F (NADH-binding)
MSLRHDDMATARTREFNVGQAPYAEQVADVSQRPGGQGDLSADPVPRSDQAPGAGREPAVRLTAGWRDSAHAAGLREHTQIYGPLPRRRGGRDLRGLVDAVAEAGLTGRGGAAFPTGTKLQAVAARRGTAVVVANGMEGEPASEKDQALMSRAPHLVLDGAVLAAQAVGADTVHLCLPQPRQWLVEQMTRALADRRRVGLDPVPVQLHEVPHHYVSSEETSLIRWLNGGEAKPQTTPPRPFEKGVGRRPTLVDNVETLAHVALIARYGPAWFRRAGLPHAPGTMLATVSGAVTEPGVYEIDVGTAAGDVLAMSGASRDASAVLLGGYFGTWHDIDAVAGLPVSAPDLRQAGASPGAGVIIVLPPDACGLAETARVLAYLAGQSARQCGPCTFGLPAIAEDFAQLASGRAQGHVLDRLQRRFGMIAGRGACHHPDGAVRLAASALTAFAADAHAHISHRPCQTGYRGAERPAVLPIPRPSAEGAWR